MTTDSPQNISDIDETDLDWENRRLCSDDSCIGVIGADGRCRICGRLDPKAHEETAPTTGMDPDVDDPQEPPLENQDPDLQEPAWEDRRLCKDESCIGTIGANGRCNICGLTE
jgi:hypothetical protein